MDIEIEAQLQKVKEANRPPFWQSTPEAARSGPMLMSILFGDAPAVERVDNFMTRKDMQWFWNHSCPDETLRADPRLSPLHANDLSAVPPGIVVTAGRDPLRDEGEAYGEKLQEAGVATEVVRGEGLVHGSLSMIHDAPSAGRAYGKMVAAIAAKTGG
jgi:acetyl esterase/lipase